MTLESSIEDVILSKFIFPEQSKTKVNDLTMDSQLTKLHLCFGSTKSSDALRDQKELAMKVEGQTEYQSA
jgi:hypothetical protein